MTLLSDPREASGRDVATGGHTHSTDLTDGELLAAVRSGDTSAYATLYELHAESVQRLARRLCRDRHEADDVASEVFANTLRAIQNGGGPRDEFGLYALRSVRNTVTKLRTRTDTAHATPSELDVLDRADDDDPFRLVGDIEQAFAELPERFQHVLWTTAVEGHTPTELAEQGATGTDGLDPGALASLSQRARKALGRSYLRVRTNRPARHPECHRVRGYLPGYVQHTAGAGTAQRIEAHLAHCADCAQIRDEMHDLNGKLRTTPWLALLAAAVRRVAISLVTAGTPVAATAVAPIVAIAVAGALIVRHDAHVDESVAAQAVYSEADSIPTPDAVGTEPGHDAGPEPQASPVGPGADDAVDLPPTEPATVPPADDTGPTPTVPADGTNDGTTIAGTPLPTGTATTPDIDESPTTGAAGTPDATPPAGTDEPGTGGPATPPVSPATGGGGVVGGLTGGLTDDVLPAATNGVGTLLDDVNGTVTDLGNVVGALPDGLPAVLTETGNLVNGVGTTVTNTLDTVTNVAGAATDTVGATVTTVVATVDQLVVDVGNVVTVDPDDPVGGLLDDVLGSGGLLDNTLGNLLGGTPPPGPAPTPVCLPLVGCLP
ncbi:MAG TPA: sigma-70 family RNA polymerase sigma factor [Ilumatobacter sp.]|nr:sigma-70 family RNA polymerase sigma factor [Ilumatobacter sp.]